MPVQIIMTEGLASKVEAQKAHAEISQVFLDLHQISNNSFMLPNIIGEVVFVEEGLTFSGKAINLTGNFWQAIQRACLGKCRIRSRRFVGNCWKSIFK